MFRLFAHSQNDYSKPYRSSSADRPFVPSFFSAWIFGEKKNKSKNENENGNEKNKNRKRIRGKTRPRKILEEKKKKAEAQEEK